MKNLHSEESNSKRTLDTVDNKHFLIFKHIYSK